jgi:hypothetical protein
MSKLKEKLAKLIEEAYERKGIYVTIPSTLLRRNHDSCPATDIATWQGRSNCGHYQFISYDTMTSCVRKGRVNVSFGHSRHHYADEVSI